MTSNSGTDAYVSIRAHETRFFGDCSGPDSFVFVDNGMGGDATALRRLPPAALRNPRASLVIRATEPEQFAKGRWRRLDRDKTTEGERIAEVIERWELEMPVGLVHQPVGRRAWLETVQGKPTFPKERARAIELESLLTWGGAIWQPPGYHYRLPSGEHAPAYVKMSDAIREPRDAEILASWLACHLADNMGFVLDTGTLTPVFEAVARMMVESKLRVGTVTVLEHYPRTSADVDDAVEEAAGDEGRVLALLSVNSSGSVRDRLLAAFDRIPGLDAKGLVVLIDKDRRLTNRDNVETWSPLLGGEPLVRRGARARESCPICVGGKDSRLIPINPFTFDGMTQGQLRPVMPSVNDAQANRDFWEECNDGYGTVAVESRSRVSGLRSTPESPPMTVRIQVSELIQGYRFRKSAKRRLESLTLPPSGSDPLSAIRWNQRPLDTSADLVLVPEHEFQYDGFLPFWNEMKPLVAPNSEIEQFPLNEDFGMDRVQQIRGAKSILIFALGTVSGHSLQRALYAIQHHHSGDSYQLQGLVLHARLPTSREWHTLCNSFDGALHAAWISFLPNRSPLQQEKAVLSRMEPDGLSTDVGDFLDDRLRLCNGEVPAAKPPLFWGMSKDSKLTRNSIFGQRLNARTTFAAVGASMARSRIDHDRASAPEVRVFDLAGMLRSYYDPLIIASFFRWLEPYEGWWGWQAWEARRTMSMLFGRLQDQDEAKHILVPELLLAVSQGKVHDAAVEVIMSEAQSLRSREDLPRHVATAFDLGMGLVETLGAASEIPDMSAAKRG